MRKSIARYGVIAIFVMSFSGLAEAASPKSYQVTGPVLEVSDSMIVVQKGKERWEIARTGNTRAEGDLKVGARVTVMYTMTAIGVEVKGEKAEKK